MANKQAKKALESFKQEAANEVGVNLKQGYNGDLTSRQAGSIGGQMVKKMILRKRHEISKYPIERKAKQKSFAFLFVNKY